MGLYNVLLLVEAVAEPAVASIEPPGLPRGKAFCSANDLLPFATVAVEVTAPAVAAAAAAVVAARRNEMGGGEEEPILTGLSFDPRPSDLSPLDRGDDR
jgi:hypothetical protein